MQLKIYIWEIPNRYVYNLFCFIEKLLSYCLIKISYIQLRNGAYNLETVLTYRIFIAHFSLHTANEKYMLILRTYFMLKSSSDSATDFIPYCSFVLLQTYMITV